MTVRLKITAALVVLSVLGVTGATALVLQKAIEDKRSYATELNSVFTPQIRSEADAKFKVLMAGLNELGETLRSGSQKAVADKLKSIRQITGVESVFFNNQSKNFVFAQLNEDSPVSEAAKKVIEKIDVNFLPEFEKNKLSNLESGIFLHKTESGPLIGVVLSPRFLTPAFELARGKDSFIVKASGQVLFQSAEPAVASQFDMPDIGRTGADIISTEMTWPDGKTVAVYFSKLTAVSNSYVLIMSKKITWMDLAGPILNSSLSLVVILVLVSVILAFSISGSIAKPIERIAEETAKIGLGEWNPITVDSTSGEVAGLAVAFNNMIGNLKKREDELKVANTKLVQSESLAAVGRIGAGIAHEVKNPLASILSYGQLMDINIKNFEKTVQPESAEKLEKLKNYTKMMMDDTRRASKIISDLLTFSRQKDVQRMKLHIKTYLTEASEKLKTYCEPSGVIFSTDFSVLDEKAEVEIDPDQIYQVLFNLVQNAVHALKEKPDEKNISLSVFKDASKITFSIKDNGNGIAPENLSKIFEPFFSTKGIGEGSGLGLAICYGIVQKHSGQLTVHSEIKKGTKFDLTLPLAS